VLKPSEVVPLKAFMLAEAIHKAGLSGSRPDFGAAYDRVPFFY